MNYLWENGEKYLEPIYNDGFESVEDYCNLYGQKGQYGGQLEIIAVASALEANFIIH